MKKLEFEISEKEIAEEIIDLKNQGFGYRIIAQKMTNKGYGMSKDTAYRIYKKYRPEQQEVKEDKETQQLMKREMRAQSHLESIKKKNALKKSIVDLHVNEIMVNFEKRKKIFSDENQLLKFAKRTMAFLNPQLWEDFTNYCGEKYELSSMVSEALGPQRDFEKIQNSNEKKNLDKYLETQLKETLKQWRIEDQEKTNPDKDAHNNGEIVEENKDYVVLSFPHPPDWHNPSWDYR